VPAQKVRGLIEHQAELTVEDRSAYRWALNADYRAADMDLAVVRSAGFLRGPIDVLDDAILLLRADRPPATPFLVGYDGRSAAELEHDLRAPPVHRREWRGSTGGETVDPLRVHHRLRGSRRDVVRAHIEDLGPRLTGGDAMPTLERVR
jgi:hypothetical protein